MSRLLILSCSRRKRNDARILPAIQRYNGPAFQVVRKYLNSDPQEQPDVFVLSAKFGLISSRQPLLTYDRRMTRQIAEQIQPFVLRKLQRILTGRQYDSLFLALGKDYLEALRGFDRLVPSSCSTTIPGGGLGGKLTQLSEWLGGKQIAAENVDRRGYAVLRGVRVELQPDEVLDIARRALEENKGNYSNYQTWYIQVDDTRVSAKWLVSQLTGLPVSSFHGIEARKVLERIGIETRRL